MVEGDRPVVQVQPGGAAAAEQSLRTGFPGQRKSTETWGVLVLLLRIYLSSFI